MESHKSQVTGHRLSLILIGLLLCSGCGAGLKEDLRGFAGISTKVLEDGLPAADTKEFNLSYAVVYSKVMDTLKQIKAYIYTKNDSKNLIAVYVSEEDTTPVGIFFKGIGKDRTRVQVFSPSSYAKGVISRKIFDGLDKLKQ